jgi:hypothetical protein
VAPLADELLDRRNDAHPHLDACRPVSLHLDRFGHSPAPKSTTSSKCCSATTAEKSLRLLILRSGRQTNPTVSSIRRESSFDISAPGSPGFVGHQVRA